MCDCLQVGGGKAGTKGIICREYTGQRKYPGQMARGAIVSISLSHIASDPKPLSQRMPGKKDTWRFAAAVCSQASLFPCTKEKDTSRSHLDDVHWQQL